ncbi:hydrogenase maturation nickel metallochaperone HypA [Trichloromonas sp.]|uniref:hydrogenase maturation nickel metallochaperone HypA n=1 Tax=Trichloromonas sp. TaxID=3069249 RepID=UPI003D819AE2
MHEVGITRSIVEICEENARRQGATIIRSVTVEIGELSGVVPEAVEFCFEACSKGTLLEEASLIIDRIPGRGRCGDCRAECGMDPHSFECPTCGSLALQRIAGDELRVTEMEID